MSLKEGVLRVGIDETLKLEGGIIKIITDHKVKTLYGEHRTLKECYELSKTMGDVPTTGVMVMHEETFSGKVYRYGEHGAFWEQAGTLTGFA